MPQSFDAIYEKGVLRPLEEVDLPDNGRVHVTVNGSAKDEFLDLEYHAYAASQADPTNTADNVCKALSGIKGSMSDAVISERDER